MAQPSAVRSSEVRTSEVRTSATATPVGAGVAGVVAAPSPGSAPVSLVSQVRPHVTLAAAATSGLLAAAARQDVWLGGCFRADESGAQVWDGPASAGDAVQLGSVAWSSTPDGGVDITSVAVTPVGLRRGEGTLTVLARVLALAGLPLDGSRVALAVPLA